MSQKIVLATSNPGKVAELQQHLQEFGFEVFPQSHFGFADAIEDGLSFVENAIIKARHACENTNLPAVADDSGLEVDALNGAPGIYSSRYYLGDGKDSSPEPSDINAANNAKLLDALKDTTERGARFRCVIVYMRHALDPTPIICHGSWEGEIALETKGEYGFGYDPLFWVPEYGCHAAELEPAQKKLLSHRAKALIQLKTQLNIELGL